MKKINKLLEEFNGQTFASNEDVTEHLRIAIKHLMKEMADDIINVVKNEEDWLEMHKIESKFESGKSVGVARALVLVETVINKYLK